MKNQIMMNRISKSPRAEHAQKQRLRVDSSVMLSERFPQLKSLTVNLEFLDHDGATRTKEVKYKVNLEHARSVFLFACANLECVGGDFDLT